MVRELFQVVKDHDNEAVKSLVKKSNRFGSMDGQRKKFVPHLVGQNQDHPCWENYDFVTK